MTVLNRAGRAAVGAAAAGALACFAVQASAQTGQTDSRSERKSEAAQTASPSAPAAVDGYVSAAAKRIELKLSGYFQQWVYALPQNYRTRTSPSASSRNQSTNTVDQKHNSEICVIGQTTLDNGLTIGVNVQIEANTSSDQIDESFLFLQSPTLGRLELGDTDNAAFKLHVTSPDGGISIDHGDLCNHRAFEVGSSVQAPGTFGSPGGSVFDTPICTTNVRLNDNDSGKINYFTPRYAGFQAGFSYIPEFEQPGGDNNSALRAAGTGDLGRNSGQYNGFATGLNYTEKLGDVGVQASLGYLYAETSDNSLLAATSSGNIKNLIAYNAGAQFSYAGFSFGGGYLYVPQGSRGITTAGSAPGLPAGTQLKFNGESWSLGAAYEFGPYKVGVDYITGTNNKTSSGGKDRLEQALLSGTWTMGPGIRFVNGLVWFNWQEENKLSQNSGIGGISAFKLSF